MTSTLRSRTVAAVVLLLSLPSAGAAATWVWPSFNCIQTLQQCINSVAHGDIVEIASQGPIQESLQIEGKSLILRPYSGFLPVFAAPSIVVFGGSGVPGGTVQVTLQGLTFKSTRLILRQTGTDVFDVRVVDNTILDTSTSGNAIEVSSTNSLPFYGPVFFEVSRNRIHIRGTSTSTNLGAIAVGGFLSTARGKIVTPLKDRIGSEIRTHYPETIELSALITASEAFSKRSAPVFVPEFVRHTVEAVAFAARRDRRVDKKSGVSQRLAISVLENAISSAERRALAYGETEIVPRIADVYVALPAVTGKIELEYEGEMAGGAAVGRDLVREGLKEVFAREFGGTNLRALIDFFEQGGEIGVSDDRSAGDLLATLSRVPGLLAHAGRLIPERSDAPTRAAAAEFILEGLFAQKKIGRSDEGTYVAVERKTEDGGPDLERLERLLEPLHVEMDPAHLVHRVPVRRRPGELEDHLVAALGIRELAYGKVASVEGSRIRLEIVEDVVLDRPDPHEGRQRFRFGAELYSIPWGEERFLVPAELMQEFCALAKGTGWNSMKYADYPCKLRRNESRHRSSELQGLPEVPAEFRAYLPE